MRKPMKRWVLRLDEHTERTLRERAKAHRVSMAVYARAAIAGARPGGGKGQQAAAADLWWDFLAPSRRAQVHGWLTAGGAAPTIDVDQLAMFETEES